MTDREAAMLDSRLEQFRTAFGRGDRLRWAAAYIVGLLSADGRKNVSGLARQLGQLRNLQVEDIAQAMQNFVNQSPWDENAVWRRHRELLANHLAGAEGVLLLEEVPFVKQGRNSVGVQRQFSNVLGGKRNCQIAVAIAHAGPDGIFPLGLRLYLPRAWLADRQRLDAAGVPDAHRHRQTRGSVAVDLLRELRDEGWPARSAVVGAGITDETLISFTPETGSRIEEWCDEGRRQQRQMFEDLGMYDFEGRSWRGFHHHACLVMLACDFRQASRAKESQGDSHG